MEQITSALLFLLPLATMNITQNVSYILSNFSSKILKANIHPGCCCRVLISTLLQTPGLCLTLRGLWIVSARQCKWQGPEVAGHLAANHPSHYHIVDNMLQGLCHDTRCARVSQNFCHQIKNPRFQRTRLHLNIITRRLPLVLQAA